jgi:hypothetical protein
MAVGLPMGQKELLLGKIMEMVKRGKLTIKSAVKELKTSYRQGPYGIPQALYCDRKNAFVITRGPTEAELAKGMTKPKSHFGKAREKPGIEVIAANSPQAKGRAGRNHGPDQDRLVKELRLAGISTTGEANKFLNKTYLPKTNAKFSRPAADAADAHIPPRNVNLSDIMCREYERTEGSDYVARFECHHFQILKSDRNLPRPKDKVTVLIRLDDSSGNNVA